MTRFFYFFSLIFHVSSVFCQTEVVRLPVQFSQFHNDWSAVNPALLSIKSSHESNAGTQFMSGPWSNIYTYYASTYFRLKGEGEADNLRKLGQAFGFSFFGDREGKLLKRLRGYAKCAVRVPIRSTLWAAAGASLGFMNYTVVATPVSAGGTSAALDADIGLLVYGEDWHFGLSFHQIPSSKVRPIKETTWLVRYMNYAAMKEFDMGPNLKLNALVLYRWVPDFCENTTLDLNLQGVISEKVSMGVGYRQKRGWTTMIGLEQIPMDKGNLRVVFAYNLANRKAFTNVNTFEASLKYRIKD